MSEKDFPKHKILSANDLVNLIEKTYQDRENGKKDVPRFCFILGSGASVESGIPTGNRLELEWMNFLMDADNKDEEAQKKKQEQTRKKAESMKILRLISNPFSDIEQAWREVRQGKRWSIPSEYYFDIFNLRFYPDEEISDHFSGDRFMESIMEKCFPSMGYYSLALLLTKDNWHNLVITTNFDNLVEDALFIFGDKKPLVASHESLAGFINDEIKRPVIAKVHRSLFLHPLNTPEDTSDLTLQWQAVLNRVLKIYTPIVIGYGGGDRSLMRFLEDEAAHLRKGIYWCYRENDFPGERVQKLVKENEKGRLVLIKGFDALMLEIGAKLFGRQIIPTETEAMLKGKHDSRSRQYNERWNKLREDPDLKIIIAPLERMEQEKAEERAAEGQLTYWDYIRRGNRFCDEKEYEKAILEYEEAMKLNPKEAIAYNNRGNACTKMGKYWEAIKYFNKAIELNPEYAEAYYNRGNDNNQMGKFMEAINDYDKAIELNPDYVEAYYKRAIANNNFREFFRELFDATREEYDKKA